MQHQSIYHNWVPQWIKLPLLVLAMFPHLMLMSLFHSNSAFTASFMDIDSDDIQYLLILMYGTMAATPFIMPRFMAYFSVKYYILLMSSVSIIILYVISVTSNYHVIVVLRVLEGLFGVMEGAIFLPLITAELKTKHARIIGYTFLYIFMLTGGTVTSSLLKFTIENYDFQHMVLMILYFHVLVLIISVSIFTTHRFFKKKPLYQLGITSWFLLWVSLQSGAYAAIYGKRLMWLESEIIVVCILTSLIAGGLFLLKQSLSKRPLLHIEILSHGHIIVGIILFFIFYVIRASLNNIYFIMATVWKWPWDYIVNIQYWNVAGTLFGFLISGICLAKNVSSKIIFFIGFLLLAIDCAWFTYTLYPDTTLATICPPLFLQGVAQGFLFTPLVMYLISGLQPQHVANGLALGTGVRFWGTAIGYAIMQNAILLLSTKHIDTLSADFTETNPIFYNQWSSILSDNVAKLTSNNATDLTATSFKTKLISQSLLLSNMEIFTSLFWLAIITAIIILVYRPFQTAIKNRF